MKNRRQCLEGRVPGKYSAKEKLSVVPELGQGGATGPARDGF
jgi:hypothetical protein